MTGRSVVGHRADGVDAPDVAAPDVAAPGQAMRLIGKTTTMSKWAEAERWGPHPQGVLCKIEACTNVTILEQSTDARASAKKHMTAQRQHQGGWVLERSGRLSQIWQR